MEVAFTFVVRRWTQTSPRHTSAPWSSHTTFVLSQIKSNRETKLSRAYSQSSFSLSVLLYGTMPSFTGIYNVVVFGEPNVGKTCFIDQFCYGRPFVIYDPDKAVFSHKIIVDNEVSDLTLIDLSTSFLKPEHGMQHTEWAEKMLAEAEGIVLLYDVASLESFNYVNDQAYNFLWQCRRLKCKSDEEPDDEKREIFGCVLVGNKLDLITAGKESREVSQSQAEEWAQTQGFKNVEVDSLGRRGPEEALKLLVRNIKRVENLETLEWSDKKEQDEWQGKVKKSSIRSAFKEVFRASRN